MAAARVATGGAGILLTGGFAWRVYDRAIFSGAEGEPYEIWDDWLNKKDISLVRFCQAAALAPSPKNSQPWAFKIANEKVLVLADLDRHVGQLDPTRRQLYLSIGCAIENLTLAAMADGFFPTVKMLIDREISLSSESGLQLVAEISFMAVTPHRSPLHQAIAYRSTNRSIYDLYNAVPGGILSRLLRIGNTPSSRLLLFSNADRKGALIKNMIIQSLGILASNVEIIAEDYRWLRWSKEEVAKFRDGMDLNTFGISTIKLPVTKIMPRPSPEVFNKDWVNLSIDRIRSSNYIGVLAIPQNMRDSRSAITTGRIWQRLWLSAESQKLAIHPVNALVTTLEVSSSRKTADLGTAFRNDIMEVDGWDPAIIFRLGYPTVARTPSPRRPMDTILMA